MNPSPLKLAHLVHENLSIIATFAYSQRPLQDMMTRRFGGRHPFVEKALFEISSIKAEKACHELAHYLRMLDDEERITKFFEGTGSATNCGILLTKDREAKELPLREVANKIIHSSRIEWNLERDPDPAIICHSRDGEKWVRAEIDLVALSFACGRLAS